MKRGNLSFRCEGRTSSGEPDKRESTDAEHRGGSIRSSVEVPVTGMERRGRHARAFSACQLATGMNGMEKAKPFDIPKRLVWKVYQLVRANDGAAGIDGETLEKFDEKLSKKSLQAVEPNVVGQLPSIAC